MGILLFVLKYIYIFLLLKMINCFSWPVKNHGQSLSNQSIFRPPGGEIGVSFIFAQNFAFSPTYQTKKIVFPPQILCVFCKNLMSPSKIEKKNHIVHYLCTSSAENIKKVNKSKTLIDSNAAINGQLELTLNWKVVKDSTLFRHRILRCINFGNGESSPSLFLDVVNLYLKE